MWNQSYLCLLNEMEFLLKILKTALIITFAILRATMLRSRTVIIPTTYKSRYSFCQVTRISLQQPQYWKCPTHSTFSNKQTLQSQSSTLPTVRMNERNPRLGHIAKARDLENTPLSFPKVCSYRTRSSSLSQPKIRRWLLGSQRCNCVRNIQTAEREIWFDLIWQVYWDEVT